MCENISTIYTSLLSHIKMKQLNYMLDNYLMKECIPCSRPVHRKRITPQVTHNSVFHFLSLYWERNEDTKGYPNSVNFCIGDTFSRNNFNYRSNILFILLFLNLMLNMLVFKISSSEMRRCLKFLKNSESFWAEHHDSLKIHTKQQFLANESKFVKKQISPTIIHIF